MAGKLFTDEEVFELLFSLALIPALTAISRIEYEWREVVRSTGTSGSRSSDFQSNPKSENRFCRIFHHLEIYVRKDFNE